MAAQKRPYRLPSNLSRVVDGRRQTFPVGDIVELTPNRAKQLGATEVSSYEYKAADKVSTSVTTTETNDDSDSDVSISDMNYQDAVAYINKVGSVEELTAARKEEVGGKKRVSVIEAIDARVKEINKK